MALNAACLPPLHMEAAILDGKTVSANLLMVFAKCIITKGTKEEEDKSAEEEDKLAEEEEGKVASEGGETDNKIKDSAKENAKTLANITAN